MWHFNGTSWVHHRDWTDKPRRGEYVFSTVDGRMYYYTGSRYRAINATPCTYIMARTRTDKAWYYPYHFTDKKRWEIPELVERKWYYFKNGGWSQWTGRPKKEGESGWRDPAPGDANFRIEKVDGFKVNVIVEIADKKGRFVLKHTDREELDTAFKVDGKWFILEMVSGKYFDAKTGQIKEKQVYQLSELIGDRKVPRAVVDSP